MRLAVNQIEGNKQYQIKKRSGKRFLIWKESKGIKMIEQTKRTKDACNYLTITEEGNLYLNCCILYGWNESKKPNCIILTTEQGKFRARMNERFFAIDNPNESDIWEHCESIIPGDIFGNVF